MFKSCMALFALFLAFYPLKINGQQRWPLKEWPVSTPALQEMNADALQAFDKEMAEGKFGNADEMLVTRHGSIVYHKKYKHDYEKLHGALAKKQSGLNPFPMGGPFNYYNAWWHPFYHGTELHSLQSVTKSVTSVIIGVAAARNEFPELSATVLSFFDTARVKNIDGRKRRMTIRHLLTMTGGFDWEEGISFDDPKNDCSVMEAGFDWVQYAIDKPMAAEPGERFKYNSGGSQLLSYIFSKATGKDIEQYAAEHLFKPLGIEEYYWKRTPTGLADTEGGLYLKATDLAKICYLYLRDGNWNGRQLVTPGWVKASVTPSSTVNSNIKYGYKWWLAPYGADKTKYAWCCRGFGDQTAVIVPEYDIVAVVTGWNAVENGPHMNLNVILSRIINAVTVK
jgi:CubicO group peptidase (beta-lactamase class C family)